MAKKTLNVATVEARQQFAELINLATYSDTRIIFTRRGKEVCALVSMDDLDKLKKMEKES